MLNLCFVGVQLIFCQLGQPTEVTWLFPSSLLMSRIFPGERGFDFIYESQRADKCRQNEIIKKAEGSGSEPGHKVSEL